MQHSHIIFSSKLKHRIHISYLCKKSNQLTNRFTIFPYIRANSISMNSRRIDHPINSKTYKNYTMSQASNPIKDWEDATTFSTPKTYLRNQRIILYYK